jgi:hypothetical protein
MTMKKIAEIEAVSLDMFREEIVPAGKAVVMRGAVERCQGCEYRGALRLPTGGR